MIEKLYTAAWNTIFTLKLYPGLTKSCDFSGDIPFNRQDIKKILAMDAEATGGTWLALFELYDGRFIFLEYNWGSALSPLRVTMAYSEQSLINSILTEEQRKKLGIHLYETGSAKYSVEENIPMPKQFEKDIYECEHLHLRPEFNKTFCWTCGQEVIDLSTCV